MKFYYFAVTFFAIVIGYFAYAPTHSIVRSIAGIAAVFCMSFLFLFFLRHSKKKSIRWPSLQTIDRMTGREFEQFLATLYEYYGYTVLLTQQSNDFGADLILEKRGRRIAVQAKRYKNKVGLRAVQEVHSAMAMYDASEGWVVTNHYFTKPAQQLAEKTNVQLIGRYELRQLLQK